MSMDEKLLVVDDMSTNLVILKAMLKSRGKFQVDCAQSGETALPYLAEAKILPDLILLDVHMPGMSGFDVLAHVRSNPSLTKIPVIMLTGEEDSLDEERALSLGANDFVHKPVNPGVLLARIHLHLEMRRHRENLEDLIKERSEALIHTDRMATLGVLSAGAAHEINNPTTFIAGNIATLERFWEVLAPFISDTKDPQLLFVHEEMPKVIQGMKNGVERISKIVRGLKSFARSSAAERRCVDVHSIIDDALTICNNSLQRLKVSQQRANMPCMVFADPQQIEQIIANLLTNAADALEECTHGEICIQTTHLENSIELTISDNGPGIPFHILRHIWNPFFTTKPQGKGTGLGLSIAKGITEEHGGTLHVVNLPSKGACFTLTLPAIQDSV